MAGELIDLAKIKPSEAFTTFTPTDAALIVSTGTVGYLAKEAFKHFFPGRPTVAEQLKVLAELIEACGKANAKSLKVRISTAAKTQFEMPKLIQEAKVLRESADTIDLEIVFAPQSPRRGSRPRRAGMPRSRPHSPNRKATVAEPSPTTT
jgi:hypothetical protein